MRAADLRSALPIGRSSSRRSPRPATRATGSARSPLAVARPSRSARPTASSSRGGSSARRTPRQAWSSRTCFRPIRARGSSSPTRLGGQGYRVLTFDFRGYCPGGDAGCSRGDEGRVAALGRTSRRRSPTCERTGSSASAWSARAWAARRRSSSASQPDGRSDAVVTLSAPRVDRRPGGRAGSCSAHSTAAKLFIAGIGDATGAAQSAQTFYDESAPAQARGDPDHDATTAPTCSRATRARSRRNLIDQWLERYVPGLHMTRPIVFLTDYGLARRVRRGLSRGHGADRARCPGDRSHPRDPRQDVMRGALTLGRATGTCPPTPCTGGRGPGRRLGAPVRSPCAPASGAVLVGPDNGLLSLAWEALGGAGGRGRDRRGAPRALHPVSRDLPRPRRVRPGRGAPRERDAARGARAGARPSMASRRSSCRGRWCAAGAIGARVTGVDGFGNVQLNVTPARSGGRRARRVLDRRAAGRRRSVGIFADVPEGRARRDRRLAGTLALVVNQRQRRRDARLGDRRDGRPGVSGAQGVGRERLGSWSGLDRARKRRVVAGGDQSWAIPAASEQHEQHDQHDGVGRRTARG